MIDAVLRLDRALFFFINQSLANPALDRVMPLITKQENWYPLFLLIIIGLLWKGGRTGRIAVALLIPLILLSDQITSGLIKPLVDRTRPCEAFEAAGTVRALLGVKTSPSFPSSHAANAFAAAAFFALLYPKRQWIYWIIAVLIALSRVYVGVHYPLDVIVGAAIGVMCAFLIYAVYTKINPVQPDGNDKKLTE